MADRQASGVVLVDGTSNTEMSLGFASSMEVALSDLASESELRVPDLASKSEVSSLASCL